MWKSEGISRQSWFARVGRGMAACIALCTVVLAENVPQNPDVLFQESGRQPWNEIPKVVDQAAAAAQAVPQPADPPVSVFVHFAPAQNLAARPAVRNFAAQRGALVKYEYDILPNVINIRNIPRSAVAALANMPGVVKVEDDYEVTTFHNDSMPLIRATQAQLTGAGHSETGAGVRVCVIDTGIDSNSLMYSGRIDAAAGWDFVNNDSNPEDDNGHGSHVAGTVLGGTNVSANFGCVGAESLQGVAPQATLIGVKVLNASGSGSASNIIAGINRCASPTLAGGQADVINLSLGGGQFTSACDSDTMAAAANNAVNAGVVVVAAAGNNNYTNAVSTPACGSQVIKVGAIYDDTYPSCEFPTQTSFSFCTNQLCTTTCTDNSPAVNSRCCFSNRSSQLDVAAPGCIIFSDDSTVAAGNGLIGFCGTSQASPHVAGLAALLLDANPSLTPAEVRTAIRNGAVDLGTAGFDSNFGFGRIDAINSLNLVAPGCSNNAQCDDGLFCNGAEICNMGNCQAGTAPNCNDGVACTTDSCNEGTDSCNNTANNAACSDGLFCNGSETCHATLGCQAGTAPNCNDGVACTTDSCNEGTDSCNNTVNHGACSDGLFCNGSETCHLTLGCQAGTAPNCDDSIFCTTDSCNEGTDSCDHAANNAACDDGLFCTGTETCNVASGCVAGGDPCPGQSCDEGTDACVACIEAGDCDDGLFCNGAEVCNAGVCAAGTAPNCDDSIACTIDSCNESTDSCDHGANNAACDDGLYCNGSETCIAAHGCAAGTDPCQPGDTCDEGSNLCIPPGGAEVWMTFVDAAAIPVVGTVQNEDIVAYDLNTGTWSMIFDGSDVGLGALNIDGLAVLPGGDLLLSFGNATSTVAGLIGGPSGTSVDDSDIIRFTPSSLGAVTAGTFNFYFDGSDVGLTTDAEDVDAITLAPDGRIVISTLDAFSVTGLSGQDEDLIVFNATSLGSVTAGTWSMYSDGSDVGLSNAAAEDVDAASVASDGSILLSTEGNFSVTGLSGADEDVFEFIPTSLGGTTAGSYTALLDLSTLGIATSEDVAAVELVE